MSKVSELVSMVVDLVKIMSDDSTINENHVMYLLGVYRAFLLKQRYEKDPRRTIPESNYQIKTLKFIQEDYSHSVDVCSKCSDDNLDGCEVNNDTILVSTEELPSIISLGIPRMFTDKGRFNYTFTRVPMSRFEVVGNNKWLSKFVYWTIGPEGKVYIKSGSNNCMLNIDKANIMAIFEDCYSLEEDDNFPIEEALIPNLLELVVKDILGSTLRPKDRDNNASDDLANVAAFIRQNMKDRYVKDTQTVGTND
jgi:hypothetical protein